MPTNDRTARAIAAQGAGLIARDQTRALILAARRAWLAQTAAGLEDGDFEPWRRAALWDAVRQTSYRAVSQSEFARALAYFGRLAGGLDAPPREAAAAAADSARRADWRLSAECDAAADAFGGSDAAERYAVALLARIHGATPATATPRQIWQVVYTLRNRAAAKRRHAAADPAAKRPETAQGGVGGRGNVLGSAAAEKRFPALSRTVPAVQNEEV